MSVSTFAENSDVVLPPKVSDNRLDALRIVHRHFETQLAEDPASPGKAQTFKELNQLMFLLKPEDSPGPLTERALSLHNRACNLLQDLSSTEDTLKILFDDLNEDLKMEDFKAET